MSYGSNSDDYNLGYAQFNARKSVKPICCLLHL
nr:MAG TPA: hypothetical protein [Caudoviricetes sp.]